MKNITYNFINSNLVNILMNIKINKLLINKTNIIFNCILSILLSLVSIPVHLNIAGVENYGNYIIFHFLLIISTILNLIGQSQLLLVLNNYPKK